MIHCKEKKSVCGGILLGLHRTVILIRKSLRAIKRLSIMFILLLLSENSLYLLILLISMISCLLERRITKRNVVTTIRLHPITVLIRSRLHTVTRRRIRNLHNSQQLHVRISSLLLKRILLSRLLYLL